MNDCSNSASDNANRSLQLELRAARSRLVPIEMRPSQSKVEITACYTDSRNDFSRVSRHSVVVSSTRSSSLSWSFSSLRSTSSSSMLIPSVPRSDSYISSLPNKQPGEKRNPWRRADHGRSCQVACVGSYRTPYLRREHGDGRMDHSTVPSMLASILESSLDERLDVVDIAQPRIRDEDGFGLL